MLPVLDIADDIAAHLERANRLVLTAPTGSGKTTQVPQIVYRADVTDGRIVVLQPRRLATRLVAQRVAHEMDVELGTVVGYQTRQDSRVSRDSRIVFMTEGLFLRQLQGEPEIRGVGAVVLDEFHERSVQADTALALLRRLQDARRPDLRLVVMSATLDADAVASYLDCDTLHAEGRAYPVDVSYLPKPAAAPVWDLAADALDALLARGVDGHVLVFMPRVYEITRTLERCRSVAARHGGGLDVVPLHGSLSPAEQDRAVGASKRQKVIVATNVAETSITIDGVTAVIDGGLANVHRYDAQRALNVLRVEPISRASADQRAGRAGRTAPGMCVRLWTSRDHAERPAQTPPEIRRVELAETMLHVRAMGAGDITEIDWIDPPTDEAVAQARALLTELGALDSAGALTAMGEQMAAFPVHPRLARMMLDAAERGCLGRALTWAALISERDIATRDGIERLKQLADPDDPPSDLAVREAALERARAGRFDRGACEAVGVHVNGAREVDRVAQQFERLAKRMDLPFASRGTTADLLRCVLAGFADHVAVKLDDGRPHCAMTGRKGATLDRWSVVRAAGPIVALDVREVTRGDGREVTRGDGRETVLGLANRIELDWLRELHPERVTVRSAAQWNAEQQAVEQVDATLYGELVIDTKARPTPDPAFAAEMLVDRIIAGELRLEKWDDAVEQWLTRVRCVARWFPERGLITYEPDDLRVILLELCDGATRWNQVRGKPVLDKLRYALSWDDSEFVDRMAPTRIDLPSGHRMPVAYGWVGDGPAPPTGSAKIQKLYGLDASPTVAGGRVGVVVEILAPNYRPVQKTADLASFWANTYPEVKKELKRRYPKHEWR